MAKIRSYDSPQQEASGRGLNESGDARFAGDVARSQEQMFGAATGFADAIYKRQAQSEVSGLNRSLAKAREDWTQNLNNQVRQGTVNVDKLRDDYQGYMDKISGDINTPEARNFFEQQSTRLRGSLMKAAIKGQSDVVGAKAVQDYTESLNSHSNTLSSNPSDFRDIYDSQVQALDAQVKTGAIDFQTAERLKKATGSQLAESSIRGYADKNPDEAEAMLKSGQYDALIDERARNQMHTYIGEQRMAKEMESRRADAAQEKAARAKSDLWQEQNVKALLTGSLPTDSIFKSPMNADDQIKWMHLQKESIENKAVTDPTVYNALVRRSLLPDGAPQKINNLSDMAQYVSAGKLKIQDAEKINSFSEKLPENEALKENKKRLIDFATATLIKEDPMLNIKDPDGQRNMAQFQTALQKAIVQQQKDGKPVADLFDADPKAKDSFYNKVNKYRSTPEEILQKMAAGVSGQSQPDQSGAVPPAQTETVHVISPNGQKGTIQKKDLEAYKARGFKEI